MKRIASVLLILFTLAFPAWAGTIAPAEFSNKWFQAVNKHHITTVPKVNTLLSEYGLSVPISQTEIDALTIAQRVEINKTATLLLNRVFSDLGASDLQADLSTMGYASLQALIDDLPNIYVADLAQMQGNLDAVKGIVTIVQGGADGTGKTDFTTTLLEMLVAFRNKIASSQPTMGVIQ